MDWSIDAETEKMLWHLAIQNAVEYDGKGSAGSVIGRVMSIRQDLRQYGKIISPIVAQNVAKANQLAAEKGIKHLKEILENEAPDLLQEREKKERRKGLPELNNITNRKIVLRFAPNPNGPLSFGHARGITINGEYAKKYDGELILRFDDTDTSKKPPLREAYQTIEQEAEWILGFKPHRIVTASDRIEQYYEYAEKMLSENFGYVCQCSADDFREYRISKTNCPCRSNSINENLDLWNNMLAKKFNPGDAVVRVRTDMSLKNPALRDWPALRIQDTEKNPHPRTEIGSKYTVWPLLDFQSAVEDYLQGVTHIIRGKDLMDSTRKQSLLYEHFGWKYPETMYWGRVKVHEWGGFSTSQMRTDIENGMYRGWDDPRLPTLSALRGRGITADALRNFWIELGVTQKDISVPLATLYSHNIKIIDDDAPRLSFVREPVSIDASGFDIAAVDIPRHPNDLSQGFRTIDLSDGELFIESNDSSNDKLRLKEFGDFDISENRAEFIALERTDKRPIVHWCSKNSSKNGKLIMVKDGNIIEISGRIENHNLQAGQHVQIERIGYAIVKDSTTLIFCHD